MVHKKKKSTSTPVIDAKGNVPPVASQLENPKHQKQNSTKKAKIIVRNLPFSNLTEKSLTDFFSEHGKIVNVNILKKKDGKFVGCAFIEYETRQCAAKAIVKANGKEMSGRPVFVDWALPKDTFIQKVQQLENVTIKEEIPEEDDDAGEDKIFEFNIDKTPDTSINNVKKFDDERKLNSDDDVVDDDCNNDDEDDDFEDFNVTLKEEEEEDKKPVRVLSADVDEGKTIFLKKVPFSATNDDVKEAVKQYGAIVYALVCIDKLTEHSKGSAFVKFKEKESAEECLKNSRNIIIKDQQVEVTRAVGRDKLEDEKKKKKLKTKDSRNLYLVREGVIMAGSPAAATISAADMAKRLQIEQWKTQILRNLNMFVSSTRLVIHNLPPSFNDEKLLQLFQQHSPMSAVIKEARVMTDRKKSDGQGQPLSKELGFVSFTTHDDALNALRKLNNNPNVFTPTRRPIITFSIENRQILNLKQKRMERSRNKLLGDSKAAKVKSLDKMNRNQRRFLKRKEMIIRKRQDAKHAKKLGEEIENKPSSSKDPPPSLMKKDSSSISSKTAPSSSKRKKAPKETGSPKKRAKIQNNEGDFSGVAAEPGKKLKMRSRLKLNKQAEIHKTLLKSRKKINKKQKHLLEKQKKILKSTDQTTKTKKKVNLENDTNFTNMIAKYKSKIETAQSFKKWYET